MSELIKLLNVVDFQVSCFSGTVKAPETRVAGDAAVFSSVGIRVCDSKYLNPFLTARRRAERLLLSGGTRFCGAFAVGDNPLPQMIKNLAVIQNGVTTAKTDLIRNWPSIIDEWAKAHPEAADEIRKAAPDATSIDRSISTSIRVYKVQTQSEALTAAGVSDGLEAEIGQLGSQIANEIAQEVRDSWKPAGIASQRIKGTLSRIRQKAASLVFVDTRLKHVIKLIDEVVVQLPQEGKIDGRDYLVLKGLFDVLGSPAALLAGKELAVEIEQEELDLGSGEHDEPQPVIDPVIASHQHKAQPKTGAWSF